MKILFLNIILLFSLIATAQEQDVHYYIEKAKENSPLIFKSQNKNKLIDLDMQRVKSLLSKPIVNFEANLLFAPIITHDNGKNNFQFVSDGLSKDYTGYDLSYADGGQYQAFISVKQALFLGNTYKIYSQKANLDKQINENAISLTKHELEMLVSHQYILCLKSKQQVNLIQDLLKKLETQLQQMQKLVENAIYKQSDLMLMQIEKSNYQINYQKSKSNYIDNLSALNLLCGINDTSILEIQNIDLKINKDTIKQSLFISKYELDSANVLSRQLLMEQKYKPQVNLFANVGLNAIYLPNINRLGFAVGLNLSWNIFDGNQKKIQQEKSNVQLQSLSFEKQYFINQNKNNKQRYLQQIKLIDERINIVENQLLKYDKLMEMYNLQFFQGEVSIMDFRNLIKEIYTKKQEKLSLHLQKQSLINSYNYWNF